MASADRVPSSILILGSGVFGLSTAYALSQNSDYASTKITVVDRSPYPPPDGSSIDTSRIVRADYADIAYARLCLEAQDLWRNSWWGEGVYHEDGLAIAIKNFSDAAKTSGANLTGQEYMRRSLENVQRLGLKPGIDVDVIPSSEAFCDLFTQPDSQKANVDFDSDLGYINRRSGWVDAAGSMIKLREKVAATGRVEFITAQVTHLLYVSSPSSPSGHNVAGAVLSNNTTLKADLTILATGAWSPSLIDLRGLASATGQVLAYISLSPSEQAAVGNNPTILNESTGLFIITPSGNELKVARHGYGYAKPVTIPNPEPQPTTAPTTTFSTPPYTPEITHSLPQTTWDNPTPTDPESSIPPEARHALRTFLSQTFPTLANRPFTSTRICWYLDTPNSDWIVDYHPRYPGLFVATGGSGHAFKFAPVLGERVVRRMRGEEVGAGFGRGEKWDWPGEERRDWSEGGIVWSVDWRGGKRGMKLAEEFAREGKGRL
ncbi:Ubiquitin-conjugating enzyme E2 [Elsinoe australis]|uniref:Ubiquitin-conjugating enzyme E2 n=1 Tax=Elsinoe australis TaxID=40998 RepID=A0A2P8A641_9PEZI|nr:Ubiquitin-conjugating enzyme E2 [Elsinoe australis]